MHALVPVLLPALYNLAGDLFECYSICSLCYSIEPQQSESHVNDPRRCFTVLCLSGGLMPRGGL